MSEKAFVAQHMGITSEHLRGNGSVGRYVLLPGSDGRAESIAGHFSNLTIEPHTRRHNFYMGTIDVDGSPADVAVVATGTGCPSVDIICGELINLGARRLLRVGTAGSLQPKRIPIGSIVVATAAVRDEGTSRLYMPLEVPAVASSEMVAACVRACGALAPDRFYAGIVHTKDSLFARELEAGPMAAENARFMELLRACGVLASEMETAMLFTLAQIYTEETRGSGQAEVEAGTVLGIIGDESAFGTAEQAESTTELAVEIGLESIRERVRADRTNANVSGNGPPGSYAV